MKLHTFFLLLFFALSCYAFTQAPSATFTAVQTTGCAPLAISFQDQSTASPTSWLWDFGNGSTSTLQNPATSYFFPGTYTVTLTAANASGSNTLSRSGYITIYGKPSVSFSANDSTGCAPFSVQFTDGSAASAGTANVNWLWDFGNGTQATQQNPAVTFTSTGNYTVSLKVTNDKGCFGAYSKPSYIQITGGLQIAFSNTPVNRCRGPFPVSFTNNSTGPGTLTYLWNFGDGVTSTLQNPSHVYAAPGTYSVALGVTSSNGCTDTLHKINLISIQNISTSFTAPDSICVYAPINFTNTSSPAAQSSLWNFGDGSTSTTTNAVKAFSAPGNYVVRLQQTYSYCTDSFSKPIKILPQPTAAYTANTTFQCKPPLTVQFTDASLNAINWQWAFGDGATSTLQNPSHTYTAFGDYDVSLIVTNTLGCTDTLLLPGFIKIRKPVISFPGFPQLGCVPYTTIFSASINTLDNVTSYLWDFGDGATSTATTPTHTYPLQGTYNVSLTIITSTGCTEQYVLNYAINAGRKPIISFTALPNPVCAFSNVQFTSTVSEGDTWQWNFGDGTTSNGQNPVHQYTDTGTYNVTLTVTNNGCPETLLKTAFVKVNPPIAKFTYQNDCANRKRFVFTDNSTGATGWLWDFGDGSPQSTAQNPAHIFPAFGSYIVSLTVTNGACSHNKTITLNIFDEQPTFNANIKEACKIATINFTAVSNNLANIVSYDWSFSNGGTSTAQNPQVVYTTAGNYATTLITVDIYGCRDTAFQNNYIRINGPVANFSATNNNGCKGLTAQFNEQSTNDGIYPILFWQWNYGDGTSKLFLTATSPQHTYPNTGSYKVQLIVTDAFGCKDSIAFAGLVNTSSPKAAFSSPDTVTCLGSPVQFTNQSQVSGPISFWDFGDGITTTLDQPTHLYADTGTYTVKLRMTDQYGCADSITKVGYIKIRRTIAAFTVSDSVGICTPFEVKYTNTSQFYESSFWQLGNGSSTVTDPVQLYNVPGTYNIKLTVTGRGGCVDTVVKTIKVFDVSASSFSYSPLAGCQPLLVNLSAATPTPVNYFWDFGDGNTFSTKATNISYIYKALGDFVPKLIIFDSTNCLIPFVGIDTIKIIGVAAKFGWDKRQFCDSGTVRFTDSTIFNDPVTSYTWNFDDGATSSLTSPVHSYAAPGLYTVSLALQTQQNCKDTLSLSNLIKIVESPSVSIGGDTVICKNDFLRHTGIFNRSDTSVVQWQWQFPNGRGATMKLPPSQQYTTAGGFIVQTIATNSSGCADTATKNLLVNALPAVTIPTPQTTLVGTPVLLPATYSSSVVSYSWLPVTALSCTDCAQPFANPKFNTLYTVTSTDSNGCRNIGRVQVIVLCKGANVFVPNTFSPNGDGSNDVFYVRGKGLSRVKSLRIFNRWGEVVFERMNFNVNDASAGWDGSYKGKKLSPDTYIYQADIFCDNGDTLRFDGSIALIQ